MKAVFKDSNLLKKTMELYKDIVSSANFECDSTGIRMEAMDSAHISMACFYFNIDMFMTYQCNNRIILGIDFANLTKILNVAEKDDLIGFETIRDDQLSVQIKNVKTNKEWTFDLKLMEIDCDEGLQIPEMPPGWIINFDSTMFSKNVKTMESFGDCVYIGINDGKLMFRAEGDLSNAMLDTNEICRWTGNDMADARNIIIKVTSKLLSKYGSGKTLADRIELFITEDQPIRVRYLLSDNSYVMSFIAPKIEDNE